MLVPAVPTEIGQAVRFNAYGGRVRLWQVNMRGTVTRFTAAGNPVITIDDDQPGVYPSGRVVTDTYGCARRIDANHVWIREELELR
jgi:hypothetical protein